MIRVALAFALIATGAHAQPKDAAPAHNWITPADKASSKPGRIAYWTGATIMKQCAASELACVVYIQGVVDGQFAAITGTSRDVAYCIPDEADPVQVKDVVLRWLERHPEDRHRLGGLLVAAALQGAWPQC